MAKRVSLKGKGADLFFGDYAPARPDPEPVTPSVDQPAVEAVPPGGEAPPAEAPAPAARPAGTAARRQPTARGHKTGPPAGHEPDAAEAIRRAVKAPGREVSFVRLTADEKARTAEIVHAYRRRGHKTSETEISRIALNYLLLDHDERGEQSILARVLALLQA